MTQDLEQLQCVLAQVRTEIGKVIIGQAEPLRYSLITLLTGQHTLLEGVPGIAKTLLVRTLARVFSCPFARIQFTPDLMPADITGTTIFSLQRNEFTLVPGPIFTVFLLADEINRAPAKTQSALLEAMQERTVTIDRETHRLSPNFTVFATQNPIEFEGTYPLPEAQKDRFLMRVSIGWPERDQELTLAGRMLGDSAPEQVLERDVHSVVSLEDFSRLRRSLEDVAFRPELLEYLVDLVRKTRTHENILSGAGPRATQAIVLASRAYAVLETRDFVTPDDIRAVAGPVLEHRLTLRPEVEVEGVTPGEILTNILREVPVPR